jgi:hypothetical protein
MKMNLKRGLAVAAFAPLALVGFAGGAGAVVVGPENAELLSDDLIQFECWHPAFGDLGDPGDYGPLGFQVRIFVEDFNDDTDLDDTTAVQVRASDNGGTGGYSNEDAHVEKIKVSLLQNYSTRASVTRSDSDVTRDGKRYFTIHKNNINQVRVQVWWDEAGEEGDAYTVACLADEDSIAAAL